ncbi:hypothetical protein EST38_g10798 [Candolleomyces aberdarensis]|uniref:Uncharacterized protein n=1 Tax=Candolleomyces aberdarensis TaxID=2316362 RepID=A0A4Q2D9S3_9AGAR|nr:hypothetical protein EST38_g10798 [Candolleomyces aberdarensis]
MPNIRRLVDSSDPFILRSLELLMGPTSDFATKKFVGLLNSNREKSSEIVDLALKVVDGSVIPITRTNFDDPSFKHAFERVFPGLSILARILTCFKQSRSSDVQNLEAQLYPRIIESWSKVAGWLMRLAINASQSPNAQDILGLCSEILDGVAHNASRDSNKLELLSLPITAHAVFLLLSQSPSSQQGRYIFVIGGSGECNIIQVFSSFVSTEVGRQNFILTLNSSNRKTRQRIIASLIERSSQMVAFPTGLGISRVSTIQGLSRLINGVSCLLEDDDILYSLSRLNFIQKYAASYASIAEEASRDRDRDPEFWNLLSLSTVTFLQELILKHAKNPYRSLVHALDGHLFPCVELCLLNLESHKIIEDVLDRFCAEVSKYFTSSETCRAWALSSQPHRRQEKLSQRYPGERYSIMAGFWNSLQDGLQLSKTDRLCPEPILNKCAFD